MAMTINTNVVSINAQRNLGLSGNSLGTTMQRLSSGLRVNSAKDDAAGLAIAERMNAQARGLAVAARNANDGISLAQTAEGALGKMGDMLQRMRELAVQASNATNSDADREALQAEVTQLTAEIDRVAKTTTFNGQKILDGSFSGGVFQVGAGAGDNITVGNITNAKAGALGNMDYAKHTLPIKASDMTDLSEIAAGTLSLSVDGQEIQLGKLDKANSEQERVGQIVAAINSKTADSGMVAFMKKGDNAGEFEIELRSSGVKDVKDPVTGVVTKEAVPVGLKGFTTEQTGMKVWDLAEPSNGTGYSTVVNAIAGVNTTYSLGVTGAPVAASATYQQTDAYFDSVKSAYDAYQNGATIAGITFGRAADGSATLVTAPVSDAVAAVKDLALALGIQTGTGAGQWDANTLESSGNFATGGKTAAMNLILSRLNGTTSTTTAVTGNGAADATAAILWRHAPETPTALASAPVEGLDPFVAASYTSADMLAEVNSALGLTGDKALKAHQVFGGTEAVPNYVAANGDWKGADVATQFGNAQDAWEAAQAYLENNGALGISAQRIETQKGIETLSVATQEDAWTALQTIDEAIDQVNSARATLGALQTRFEKAIENIDIMNENISASRGRIVDADFAAETANLSRSQILQQAGTAMVAQANQLPQQVLSLLQ